MERRYSNRPDIIKLGDLIKNYFNNKDNSKEKAELSNMAKIKGDDLMDALDNINFETYKKLKEDYEDLKANYERVNKYYEQQDEDQKKLISTLESLLEDPFFQFIEKINNLTKVLREVK